MNEGREVLFPEIDEANYELLESYKENHGYCLIRILRRKADSSLVYRLEEPLMSKEEKKIVREIRETLESSFPILNSRVELGERERYLKEVASEYVKARNISISRESLGKIEYYLRRDSLGYGEIDGMMNDPNIEDISCNGVDIPIFVYHRSYENVKTNISFHTSDALNGFIIYLAQKGNKQISVADPILDTSTPEGSRINATFGNEVSSKGGTFTIRRFRDIPLTPIDLIMNGTASVDLVVYMWFAAEYGKNVIVLGGTGVGKTTTLNAMCLFISPTSKIVSIEDTREINVPHQNWIAATTRTGVGEAYLGTSRPVGEIDMFDLVKAALRQRPDVLVVGEIRGRESYNLFQAMSAGQITLSTMHADSIKSMMSRLENEPINIPITMMSSLDSVIIQAQRRVKDKTVRRITEISEVIGYEPETDEITTNKIFTWDRENDRINQIGYPELFQEIMETGNLTRDDLAAEIERRRTVIKYLSVNDKSDYSSIWHYVTRYYKDGLTLYEEIMDDVNNKKEEYGKLY